MPNLQLGLVCLMAAVLLAWPALIWATTHRKTRVTRKYLRLQAAQAQVFEGLYPPPAVGELEKAEKHEALAEGAVRWLTQGAYIFATGGAGSILVGVIAALGHRGCYVFTVWPLTEFN
jgi:hypothetical protein